VQVSEESDIGTEGRVACLLRDSICDRLLEDVKFVPNTFPTFIKNDIFIYVEVDYLNDPDGTDFYQVIFDLIIHKEQKTKSIDIVFKNRNLQKFEEITYKKEVSQAVYDSLCTFLKQK